MSTEKNIRIKQKADTEANWEIKNPILLDNEIGLVTDETKFKIGKNGKHWNDLDWYYHPGDAYIAWGGKNTSYALQPVDAILNSQFRANRLNFYPPDYITIESSYDGGASWIVDEVSDADKIQLCSSVDYRSDYNAFSIGSDVNHQLRITINSPEKYLYGIIRKFHFQVNAKNAIYVQIESDKTGEYGVISDWFHLTGETGWNVINLNEKFGMGSFGTNLRLTFKINAYRVDSGTSSLLKMFMYTSNFWGSGNDTMALYDRPYKLQDSRKVEFDRYTLTTQNYRALFNAGIETKGGIILPADAGGIILNNNPITTIGKGAFGEIENNGILNMNNNRITNLAAPINSTDAVNKETLDKVANTILWKSIGTDSMSPKAVNTPTIITSVQCVSTASYNEGKSTFYIYYNAFDDIILINSGDTIEISYQDQIISGAVISTNVEESDSKLAITTDIGAGGHLSSSVSVTLTCISGIIQRFLTVNPANIKALASLEIGESLTEEENGSGPDSAKKALFSIKDPDGNVHLRVPSVQTTSLWGYTTINNLKTDSLYGPGWRDASSDYTNIRSNCAHGGLSIEMGDNQYYGKPGYCIVGNHNILSGHLSQLFGNDNTIELDNTTAIGRHLTKNVSSDIDYSTILGQYNDSTKTDAIFEIGTGADEYHRHTALYIDNSHRTHLEVPTEPDTGLSPVNLNYIDTRIEGKPLYFVIPTKKIMKELAKNEKYYVASLPEYFYNTHIIASFEGSVGSDSAWLLPQDASCQLRYSPYAHDNHSWSTLTLSTVQEYNPGAAGIKSKKLYAQISAFRNDPQPDYIHIKLQPVKERPLDNSELSPKIDLSTLSITAPEMENQYTRENCIFFYKWSADNDNSYCGITDTKLILSEGQTVKAIFLKKDNTIYDTVTYDSSNCIVNKGSRYVQSVYFFAIANDLNHIECSYPSVSLLYKDVSDVEDPYSGVMRVESGSSETPSLSQHWNDSTWVDFPSQS